MSNAAIAYVQSIQSLLTESEYSVALALASMAEDETHTTVAKVRELCAASNRGARCVYYALGALKTHGLLQSEHQQEGRSEPRTVYCFPALAAQQTAAGIPPQPVTKERIEQVRHLNDARRRRNQRVREDNTRRVATIFQRAMPGILAFLERERLSPEGLAQLALYIQEQQPSVS